MGSNWKTMVGAGLLMLLAGLPSPGRGAEFRIYPAITVSEAYDDNLFNDGNNEVSEFVTRIMPSVSLEYDTSRLETALDYTFDWRLYAQGERGNETVHFLNAEGRAALVRDAIFLEVREEISRVSLSASRDFREESLFINQSDQNLFTISPYLDYRISPRYRVRTGYRYVNLTYEEDSGVDRESHVLFLEGERELTSRTTARAGAEYDDADSDLQDWEKKDLWAGIRSEYREDSFVFGTLGYTWIDFAEGANDSNLFWDLGITHEFTYLTATGIIGVRYIEDPEGTIFREERWLLSLSRDWTRTRATLDLSWIDYIDTELDELDTRRLGAGVAVLHELSSRVSGNAGVSWARFEDEVENTETDRVILELGLSYLIATDLTASLDYLFIDSHSPELSEDRYNTNRIILEARKVF